MSVTRHYIELASNNKSRSIEEILLGLKSNGLDQEKNGLVSSDLSGVEINAGRDYPLPEMMEAATDEALYHSRRKYFTQLLRYRRYRGNGQGMDWLELLDE